MGVSIVGDVSDVVDSGGSCVPVVSMVRGRETS